MLESKTLLEVLTLIFGTGGTLAVLFQRISGWDDLPATVKLVVIGLVNVCAPAALVMFKAYIPPDVLAQTPAQIIVGIATLAVAFLIHELDVLLSPLVELAKVKLATLSADWDDGPEM